MATITAGDFRNGKTFEMDGKVMQVVEFQHVKPGKGAAFVRTKMRNVVTGAVTETSFNPTAKFEEAFVDRRDMEYSYNDGDEPGVKGNTATNTLKPATVETGAEVKVPLFINVGDKITIDTRTGEYIGRTK